MGWESTDVPKALTLVFALLLWTISAGNLFGDDGAPPEGDVRRAVTKALSLIQNSAAEYAKHRQCFSCHHQAVPVLALATARARGFAVAGEVIQHQVAHTEKFLAGNRAGYQKGQGQGGQVDTAGYALWALEAGGWKPDDTTAAVAEYLLLRNKNSDHWNATSRRPPSEASDFTTTYLAVRGLKSFGTPAQGERIATRLSESLSWLRDHPGRDTEDRVFRLWALKLAGAEASDIRAARAGLEKTQRPDGGWGQTDELGSDAYATGSALVALNQSGCISADTPAYRRGLRFLLQTQLTDGSWLVKSRSKPFQVYFETGFPHGTDQFISMSATSWATAALALALPVAPALRENAPGTPDRALNPLRP